MEWSNRGRRKPGQIASILGFSYDLAVCLKCLWSPNSSQAYQGTHDCFNSSIALGGQQCEGLSPIGSTRNSDNQGLLAGSSGHFLCGALRVWYGLRRCGKERANIPSITRPNPFPNLIYPAEKSNPTVSELKTATNIAPPVSHFDGIGSGLGLLFISVSFFLFGCASSNPWLSASPKTSPTPALKKKIHIVSEPVGARIEVDQDYIGYAPITVEVEADRHGDFAHMTSIAASPSGPLPNNTPVYLQSLTFLMGQRIPSRLYFDNRQPASGFGIRLGPIPSEIGATGATPAPPSDVAMPSANPTPPSEIPTPSPSPTP